MLVGTDIYTLLPHSGGPVIYEYVAVEPFTPVAITPLDVRYA